MPVFAAFIDLSTAYNRVNLGMLCRKLLALGIPAHLLRLIALHSSTWSHVLIGGETKVCVFYMLTM